jgi:hypothetical protein
MYLQNEKRNCYMRQYFPKMSPRRPPVIAQKYSSEDELHSMHAKLRKTVNEQNRWCRDVLEKADVANC